MKKQAYFKPSLLAIAFALAFPVAAVRADEVAEMISPDVAEVAVKVFNVNQVNSLYRQYTGLDHKGVNGSLEFNLVKRSDEGRWLRMEGQDLGLETQEFKASVEQQGNWAVGVAYSEIPHYGSYQVKTPVAGIGSSNLTLPSLALTEQTLKTERTATSLTAKKFIYDNLVVNFSYKNEDKKGARLMGSNGNNLGNGFVGMVFAPEPIDSNHQQFEASLDYYTRQFQISAGYYGSFFKNNAGNALFVNYGTNAGNAVSAATPTFQSPLSLAPNNHAQEFYVSGGYNWTDDTRGTLKLSKTYSVQDANFIAASLFPASAYRVISTSPTSGAFGPATVTTRSSLGGDVETTNVYAALTSRITKEFDLLASWAYEDEKDKTPKSIYGYDYAETFTGQPNLPISNNPESQKRYRGKLEGTYRLPQGYALVGGYDYDQRNYPDLAERFRDEVTEQTYRLDLRKSISEVLNGSIRLAHSERTGSDWGGALTAAAIAQNSNALNFGLNPPMFNWAAPAQFSDRKRDKARLMLDWQPVQALSVQLAYEHSNDDYSTRVSNIGLKKGVAQLYSLDAIYQINDKFKGSLWYSHSTNNIDQGSIMSSYGSACSGVASGIRSAAQNTCVPWQSALKLTGDSLGLGVDGKVNARMAVGANVFYTHDVNRYNISKDEAAYAVLATAAGIAQGAGALPDTVYTQTSVQLFGKYAVSKGTSLRLDYIWDKRQMDDYTWSNWKYSDGTQVSISPKQITQFVGVTLVQAF